MILLRPVPRPRYSKTKKSAQTRRAHAISDFCLFVCLFWVITSKHISHYYVKSIIVHSINNYIFIFYKYTHTLVCYISIIKGCSLGAKSWSFLKTFQTRKQFNYITMHLNISNKKKIKLSLTPNTKLIPTKKTE